MNVIIRLLILVALTLIGQMAFADNGGININTDHFGLAIAPNDQSVHYLGVLFGQVGSVLNGTGTQVLGVMFGAFNHAVIIVGLIIFTYVYGKGVVDTAAHGEFLGKQNNSIWIPIRSVVGIALLIPSKAGYAAVQIFMMWVVLQGVGAADMLWGKTVAYMQHGGTSGQSAAAMANITSVKTSQDVASALQTTFSNLTCLQWAKEYDPEGSSVIKYVKDYHSSRIVSASPNAGSSPSYSAYTFQHKFGSPYAVGVDNLDCGAVYWQIPDVCSTADGRKKNKAQCEMVDAQKDAIQDIINTYKPIAGYYVKNGYSRMIQQGSTSRNVAPPAPALPSGVDLDNIFPVDTKNDIGVEDYQYAGSNFDKDAATMYLNKLGGIARQNTAGQGDSDDANSFNDDEVNEGWIYAGSYYFTLVNHFSSSSATIPSFNALTFDSTDLSNKLGDQWSDKSITPMTNASKYITNIGGQQSADHGDADTFGTLMFGYGATAASAIGGLAAAGTAASGGNGGMLALGLVMSGVILGFSATVMAIATNVSNIMLPITALGVMGHMILWLVMGAWMAALAISFYSGLAKYVMSCMNPTSFASSDASTYISGFFYVVMGSALGIGIFLAVYLPLLPFLYFMFAVLNWFIAVIETLIAAPLVALGVIHPEGHDVWGKAEPAVMLTLNVFLRPSLILFGLVCGILLSFIGIQILTQGIALTMAHSPAATMDYTDPLGFFILIVFYVGLVVLIIKQSFKLILDIPNRVLQWLGFQGQLGGNMDEAMQGASQNLSQAEQSAQQGFNKGEEAARQAVRERKPKDDTSADPNGGGDGGKSGTGSDSGMNNAKKEFVEKASREAAMRGRK